MEIREDEWDIIFDEIEELADQYFNPKFNSMYKSNISIRFSIARYEGILQAKAIPLSEKSYLIRISRGMLVTLMDLACKHIKDEKFVKLINPLILKRNIIRNFLFFAYVDLIICHEWAHVIFGHNKLANQINSDLIKPYGNKSIFINSLELEADAAAAQLILARLASNYNKVEKLIYGASIQETSSLKNSWKISIFAILSLFDSFKGTGKTHPDSSIRAFASIMFIAGEISEKPNIRNNLPHVGNNQEEIYNYFATLVSRYYTDYKNLNELEYYELQISAFKYCFKIGSIIDEKAKSEYLK